MTPTIEHLLHLLPTIRQQKNKARVEAEIYRLLPPHLRVKGGLPETLRKLFNLPFYDVKHRHTLYLVEDEGLWSQVERGDLSLEEAARVARKRHSSGRNASTPKGDAHETTHSCLEAIRSAAEAFAKRHGLLDVEIDILSAGLLRDIDSCFQTFRSRVKEVQTRKNKQHQQAPREPREPREEPHIILGVARTASFKEIKKRFRELSKKHHPDTGGDPVLFRRIVNAYEEMRKNHG